MTISIWIIFFLLVALGFWFYYKKNRIKIENGQQNNLTTSKKQSLNDLDKMIENLASDINEETSNKNQEINESEHFIENEKNSDKPFDMKESVKNSIILTRRKKN